MPEMGINGYNYRAKMNANGNLACRKCNKSFKSINSFSNNHTFAYVNRERHT